MKKFTREEIEELFFDSISKDYHGMIETLRDWSHFWESSGSGDPKHHHYGDNGLAQHTAEVVAILNTLQLLYPEVNYDVLILAAIFHDVGKVADYTKLDSGEWVKNEHARKINHISRSAIVFSGWFEEVGNSDMEDEVVHCILSHHGRREWGSPVSPKTKEAWLLHLADMISARMDDCEKFDPFDINKK